MHISPYKLFIALGEVHDAFDDPDHVHEAGQRAAAQDRYQQHRQAFLLIAKHEFMNTEGSDYDA